MRIANPNSEFSIEFNENIINILVIENKINFRNIILDLINQNMGQEGKLVLSEGLDEIDLKKYSEIIINPLDLDLNSKKIINKIYGELSDISIGEDLFVETKELIGKIENHIIKNLEYIDIPMKYTSEIDIKQLYKMMDLKVEENLDSYLEQILNYINVVREVFNTKLFIFVNLKDYISDEEYEEIYKYIQLNKINIFLIESKAPKESYNWEKLWIIDEDLCEIY